MNNKLKDYKNVLLIVIAVLIILIVFFFSQSKFTINEMRSFDEKYINILQENLKNEGIELSKNEIKNGLELIDKMYDEKYILIEENNYYYPMDSSKLSYREQQLFFYNK